MRLEPNLIALTIPPELPVRLMRFEVLVPELGEAAAFSVMVRPLMVLPAPVLLFLKVSEPRLALLVDKEASERLMSRKGEPLDPRSIVVEPGSRAVLIATLERLDREVLAPPDPPPRQFPESVQTVPPASGSVITLFEVGVPLWRVIVLPLVLFLKIVDPVLVLAVPNVRALVPVSEAEAAVTVPVTLAFPAAMTFPVASTENLET